MPEPQQNNLCLPVKRFVNIIARQEAVEEIAQVQILFLAQVQKPLPLSVPHWGKCFSGEENPEKSVQTQMVIETGQHIVNPMHESAFS